MPVPGKDPSAKDFETRVEAVQGRLRAYLTASLGDAHDAADVLQEANLVLWRKRADFEPGTSFWAWAQKVAYFQIMAFRKRRKRDRLVLDDDVLNLLATEATPLLEDESDASRLPACMKALPDRQREVIEAHYFEKQSLKALALRLSSTPAAIGQLLYRARLNLQRCLRGVRTTP
ncbi:DNA-directed RNA polymerase sigma-70 factor [Haloferula helveola]|uniref:DNA-directed RNA polymerase sigma-70 factor n=1 Tax=Haloferula helveola TaxID=490095 RepID=A0ABM7RKL6_9BACT|nr:DNA-directed RNA polymerase sigma-70 factor [Haloferula helveola]